MVDDELVYNEQTHVYLYLSPHTEGEVDENESSS
jgi:hypothetical protein